MGAELSSPDCQACRTLHALKITPAVPATGHCFHGGFPFTISQHCVRWMLQPTCVPDQRLFSLFLCISRRHAFAASQGMRVGTVPHREVTDHRKSSDLLFNSTWLNKTKPGQNSPWARTSKYIPLQVLWRE